MAAEVIMPALGVAQETGRLVEWLVAEGKEVAQGEPLFEIETDKVTVTIEAPASGVLSGVRAAEGEEVPVGRVIAAILAPGEEAPVAEAPGGGSGSSDVRGGAGERATPSPSPAGGPSAEPAAVPASGRRPASPLARRRAREAGVDIDRIAGTGPDGAVTAADLEVALASADGDAGGPVGAAEVAHMPGPVWRRMAERVTASWTSAPHFYLFREVDAGRLTAWRETLEGRVTLTDLLVLLVARALRAHPEANARWDGARIVRWSEVNVGIAVAVDEGLVVPVVHGADGMGPGQVSERRKDLVGRARAGTLRQEDVAGGTFTVSNLGMYGVDGFAAVINAPQAAILSVGRVADRVVAVDGRPEVRPCMSLALSCDHRALDGARAASFLEDLARLIEEPLGLMS